MLVSAVRFKLGDRVRWMRAVPRAGWRQRVGIILAIDSIGKEDPFTAYTVQFDSETLTLYGTQLEVVPPDEPIDTGGLLR